MKIYQLVCFVNGYNKRKKEWENVYSFKEIYIGESGLKTAYSEFETQKIQLNTNRECINWNKFSDVRGKCELQEPHIHKNGKIAYWGDKVLMSENPDNI